MDQKRLQEIKTFLGDKTEIIADVHPHQRRSQYESLQVVLLETIRRRPMRPADLANVLNLSLAETENLLKGLLAKGVIRKQVYDGQEYYLI